MSGCFAVDAFQTCKTFTSTSHVWAGLQQATMFCTKIAATIIRTLALLTKQESPHTYA